MPRAAAAVVGAVVTALVVGGCGHAAAAGGGSGTAASSAAERGGSTGSGTATPHVVVREAPGTAPSSVPPPSSVPLPSPAPADVGAAVQVADPARVVIEAIGVDAAVTAVGLRKDGEMAVPDPGLAGWYDEGPRPGEAGPAVVVAHVSSRRGPDVFHRLDELRPGDQVVIERRDGTSATWVVTQSEQTDKDDLPVDRIWDRTRRPVLRLVTCGGTIQADGHYDDNVIVYAEPVQP